VRLSEIGLSSGTLLTQAAIIAATAGLVGGVVSVLVMWAYGRGWKVDRKRMAVIVLASVGGVFAVSVADDVVRPGLEARHALKRGHKAGDLSVLGFIHYPNPWAADVAYISWAHGPPAHSKTLPTCALYLGEAGGITVLYDGATKQTWRIPSSELIVRAKPSLTECP
jgi:hypothetical protein